MHCLGNLSTCELVALASILAISISADLSETETAKLAAFFSSLGDNLALLSISKPEQEETTTSAKNKNNLCCF